MEEVEATPVLEYLPSSEALDDDKGGSASPTATASSASSDGTLVLSACDDGDEVLDAVGKPSPRMLERSPPPLSKAQSRIAHLSGAQQVQSQPPEPELHRDDARESAAAPSVASAAPESGGQAARSTSAAPAPPPDDMNHMLVVIDDFFNLRWAKLYRSRARRPRSGRRVVAAA